MKYFIKLCLLACFTNIVSRSGDIRLSDGEVIESHDQNTAAKDKWAEIVTYHSFQGVDDDRHDEIMDDERFTR